VETRGRRHLDRGGHDRLNSSIVPAKIEEAWGIVKDARVESGEFLGGKGKWAKQTRAGSPPSMVTYVQGPKYVYACSLSGSEESVNAQLDMCKSIVPLG
jgi:hypothetical protein